jgi:Cu-Zn family superoxide dismutase
MGRYIHAAVLLTLAAGATALAQSPQPVGTSGSRPTAGAVMRDTGGREIGEVRIEETPHGVLMMFALKGATPGVHGLHIHEVGTCDTPTFESAGDHFNPGNKQHGFHAATGPHAGDLPNAHVPFSKEAAFEIHAPGLTLREGPRSLLDANGSAIVMHGAPDDYRSEPAGESGDRIACGVIAQNTGARPQAGR